jgi:hypothetical protein
MSRMAGRATYHLLKSASLIKTFVLLFLALVSRRTYCCLGYVKAAMQQFVLSRLM